MSVKHHFPRSMAQRRCVHARDEVRCWTQCIFVNMRIGVGCWVFDVLAVTERLAALTHG